MSTHTTASPAGTTTQQVTWAPVARVNLLPPEIDEGRKLRRLQRLLVSAVVLTLLLMGGLYWQATRSVGSAQDDLDLTQSRNTDLQAQQQLYQEVPKVTAQLQAAQAARASVLSKDVVWNRLTDDIYRAATGGVTVDSLDISPATAAATGAAAAGTTATGAGATTTTTATTGLASVAVTGTTKTLSQVGTWISALGKVSGLGDVTLLSAGGGGTGTATTISYSITATVTADALSQRYVVSTEASK